MTPQNPSKPPRQIFIAVLIRMIIWILCALRIIFLTISLGYIVSVYMIFFLQPVVSLFATLPVTIVGLGLTETGVAVPRDSDGPACAPGRVRSSAGQSHWDDGGALFGGALLCQADTELAVPGNMVKIVSISSLEEN